MTTIEWIWHCAVGIIDFLSLHIVDIWASIAFTTRWTIILTRQTGINQGIRLAHYGNCTIMYAETTVQSSFYIGIGRTLSSIHLCGKSLLIACRIGVGGGSLKLKKKIIRKQFLIKRLKEELTKLVTH